MGQQQLLLIILGVIIVGIAIAVGITMFTSGSVQSNKDAIINDLNNLSANAYQFRIRPTSMGGGNGAYTGYLIPDALKTNDNGTYATQNVAAASVTFRGTSGQGYGYVQAICDTAGKLGTFTYNGQFAQ
jgi:hypothetical protein